METHSQVKDVREVLQGQIREAFGRVVYTHKTHEKCVDILLGRLKKIKLAQIILSAVTTAGFLVIILGETQVAGIIGVLISTTLLVLNAYTKDYDLGEMAQKHKQVANELWSIRENFISLIVDISDKEISVDKIKEKRDLLTEALAAIYTGAPSTTDQAYKKAQEALQITDDFTFSDEEINAFLPSDLKK